MGRAEGLMRCLDDLPLLRAFVSARFVTGRVMGPLQGLARLVGEKAAVGTAGFALNSNQGGQQPRSRPGVRHPSNPLRFRAAARAVHKAHKRCHATRADTARVDGVHGPGWVG